MISQIINSWKFWVCLIIGILILGIIIISTSAYDWNDLAVLGMVKAPTWATNHDPLETQSWKYAEVIAVDSSINYSNTMNRTINFTVEFRKIGEESINLELFALRMYQVDEFGNCFNSSGVADTNNYNNCYAIPLELVDA